MCVYSLSAMKQSWFLDINSDIWKKRQELYYNIRRQCEDYKGFCHIQNTVKLYA